MTFPLSSRSTQIAAQSRFPVIEFKPLLDAIEAAALLRIHPKTLQKKARRGEIPGRHPCKYWRFRVSDLNDWLSRQEQGGDSPRAGEGQCARTRAQRPADAISELYNRRFLAGFLFRDSDGRLWSRKTSAVWYPAFARSLLPGRTGALRQLALLLRLHRPSGYGFRSKSCPQRAAKRFLRSLRKCRASALGSRAPRWLRKV